MTPDADTTRLQTLMRILYDPLSWLETRASHDPRAPLDPVQCAAPELAWKNQALIDSHALTCAIDFDPQGVARWWMDHWWQLRRIAYLVGCRCARASLVASCHYARLDPAARAFLLSPVLAPSLAPLALSGVDAPDVVQPVSRLSLASPIDLTLVTQGYRCLHAQMIELPRALGQRLDLMFSDARDVLERTGAPVCVIRFQTLIASATYHAAIRSTAPCASPA